MKALFHLRVIFVRRFGGQGRKAVATTGLAAVGAFVFLSLSTHWLGLDVFCPLTSDQTFVLLLVFLIITFLALLAMLGTYLLVRRNQISREREGGERNGG